MIRGIMGKKIGMTQIFDTEGNITPVTVVEAGPCTVLGLKDKPLKVVLGYTPIKENRLKKPILGFFKKTRAIEIRCFCPPESLVPRSPT